MSGHTPGPWLFNNREATVQTPSSPNGAFRGTVVCLFGEADVYGEDSEEYKANANLIAAAPDLLAELKQTAQEYHNNSYLWIHDEHEKYKMFEDCQSGDCRRRRTIIQKAEGIE